MYCHKNKQYSNVGRENSLLHAVKVLGGFICILPGLFLFFIPWTLFVFKERATSEARFTVHIPIDRFCFNKNLFVKGGNYLESLQKKKNVDLTKQMQHNTF